MGKQCFIFPAWPRFGPRTRMFNIFWVCPAMPSAIALVHARLLNGLCPCGRSIRKPPACCGAWMPPGRTIFETASSRCFLLEKEKIFYISSVSEKTSYLFDKNSLISPNPSRMTSGLSFIRAITLDGREGTGPPSMTISICCP